MVDSVAVLPPGWRATGSNNALITDGILAFFDAGTSDPLEVFADADLSISLGVTVNCNNAGYPVSSGNAKTLIYVGVSPYKIRLTSVLFGGSVFEFDEVSGALDTSSFLTEAAVPNQSVVNTSSNRAITVTDRGSLINLNCSGGSLTATFDDAADLGDGFWIGIRHDGTANAVRITGNGTDTFGIPGASVTAFSLTGRGETVWVNCDGTGFKVASHVPPLIKGTTGIVAIADRLSAPPVSPNPGDRYILTAAPSGAWSSFAEHNIAEATGLGGWFRYTLTADCGWLAYVQDEDLNYQFQGSAWVAIAVVPASEAEMEGAVLATRVVTPANQHHHPGHPKMWGYVTLSGGTPTLQASYNVTGITDTGVGQLGVTIATDFASANWACVLTVQDDTSSVGSNGIVVCNLANASVAVGSITLRSYGTLQSTGGTEYDPRSYHWAGFGAQ